MSEEEFDDGVKAAEEFYKALCKYMGLSTEKSTDNVIRAAFGSVEFACVVALQAGITEVDFKDTVNAIWKGISERHSEDINSNINNESNEERDEESEVEGVESSSV